ncbi:MAG: TonB-dependent receptor plug domain-containing protein, partial [Candidatus Saccharimonadales bacterium]
VNGNLNKTGVAINLSNTGSKGFPAATDTTGNGNFRNDGFHQRAVSANISQNVSQNLILNGNFQASYNTGNLPQAAFTDDQHYTYANTFLFGGLGAKLKLHKGRLMVNVSQNDVQNNYTDLAGPANYNTYSFQKNTGHITDAEAVFNYGLCKQFDLTSGANFKYFSTRQFSSYDTIRAGKANNSVGGVYTSLFFKSGIFHTELGGRYNHDKNYGNNFTYTINPSLLLFNQLKIFATMASAYKSPSLYQLFSQYGNVGLRPEATSSYEAGLQWELIKKTLSFNTVFYKYDTKNVIYFKDLAASPYGIYKNGELQHDRGYESELKLSLDKLTASAYAAYVTGKLTDENGAKTNNLYRRPKNTYGINVYYQFIRNFSAGLNYK